MQHITKYIHSYIVYIWTPTPITLPPLALRVQGKYDKSLYMSASIRGGSRILRGRGLSANLHNKTGETLMFLKIASKFINLSNLKGGLQPPPYK